SDSVFETRGNGTWVPYLRRDACLTSFGPGTYVVGEEIVPGRYRSSSDGGSYQRLSNFGGRSSGTIDIGSLDGPTVVEILPTDVGFTSRGCGTWRRVG